ncbi:DUF4062 domain-containing protein [Bacteroides sp.]|uniref:DUF4062 domain-containing protein n=1 Tax=Bacteroides sp. TaxID=29523 RepID=UPI0026375BD5|nr:DUF4062 domain-containing protein [Bacteroides sp.]
MLPQRYIRFFISSTFADMTIERNLLQELMAELASEYQPQGWQIEYVDLRWGITQEAGLDNRTIQICRAELARCQQMSPKPNFIILSGQRRGWIPLPETLPAHQMEALQAKMNNAQRKLMQIWYRADTNYFEEAQYILQPREGRYTNSPVWEREVYLPLIALFNEHLPSATEIEIKDGILNAHDPEGHSHVVAYLRQLTQVPQSLASTFIETKSTDDVASLHNQLKVALDEPNLYSETLTYQAYQSTSFTHRFKQEMGIRLRKVIDHTISEYHPLETESDKHHKIAIEKQRFFVGREKELQSIDAYIHDAQANHTYYIVSASGSGKSSLIAQIYQRYEATHNVICRFCGETEATSDGAHLLNSIWTEMRRLYPLIRWTMQDLPGFSSEPASVWDTYKSATEMFDTRLHQIKEGRPLLILIDGFDQLIDEDSDECFALRWIDCELSPLVRVILTSTDDPRIAKTQTHLKRHTLDTLPPVDALRLVGGLLVEKGRVLTPDQCWQVEQAIASSDKRPIYLTLLGDYLCGFASYETIPPPPSDFTSLLRLVLHTLTSARHHDAHLVKSALTLLYCERQGLTHAEMQRVLSLDSSLMEHLKEHAHHSIQGNTIPPILWSRLYHDLEFFFRQRQGKYGNMIYIYHHALAQAIQEIYLSQPTDLLPPYNHLALLYQGLETPHAIHEATFCDYRYVVQLYHIFGKYISLPTDNVIARFQNPTFLHVKLMLDRSDLMNDLDLMIELSKICTEVHRQHFLNLKKDLAQINRCTYEQFLLYCANTHPMSPLRGLAQGIDVIPDGLCNSRPYDLTVYASGKCGEHPLLSNDGSRILSLKRHKHRVHIEDMDELGYSKDYDMHTSILTIDATPNLLIHALATQDGAQIYDYIHHKVLNHDAQISSPTWITLSDDGKIWAYGHQSHCFIAGFGLQNWGCHTARLSPSGRYLWYSTSDGVRRYDLVKDKSFGMTLNDYKADDESTLLLAASEDKCILRNNNHIQLIVIHADEKQWSGSRYRFMDTNSVIAGIHDDDYIIINEYEHSKCYVVKYAEFTFKQLRSTSMEGITALSKNLAYAYDNLQNLCYRLPLLCDTMKSYSFFNAGINTISSSRKGELIAVTIGKNEVQDRCTDLLLIHHGKEMKIDLSQATTYPYFMSCAVSPAGDRVWISESDPMGDLICLSPEGHILGRIAQAGGKLAMRFTEDGSRLVAACGHHIASLNPTIHVIDAKSMTVIAQFLPEEMVGIVGVMNSYEMRLSKSGRYAIFHKFKKNHVVDIDRQLLLSEEQGEKTAQQEAITSRFKINKDGIIEYQNSAKGTHGPKAYMQHLCLWQETSEGLAAVSWSGKVSFFYAGSR